MLEPLSVAGWGCGGRICEFGGGDEVQCRNSSQGIQARDSASQYKVKIALHFIGVFIVYLCFTLYSLYIFSVCNSQNTLHFIGAFIAYVCYKVFYSVVICPNP